MSYLELAKHYWSVHLKIAGKIILNVFRFVRHYILSSVGARLPRPIGVNLVVSNMRTCVLNLLSVYIRRRSDEEMGLQDAIAYQD